MSDAAIESRRSAPEALERLISGGAGAITKAAMYPLSAEPRGMPGLGGPLLRPGRRVRGWAGSGEN